MICISFLSKLFLANQICAFVFLQRFFHISGNFHPHQRRSSLTSIVLSSVQPSLNGSPRVSTASAPLPSVNADQQTTTVPPQETNNSKVPSVAVTIETCINGDIPGHLNVPGQEPDIGAFPVKQHASMNVNNAPSSTVDPKLLTVPNNLPTGAKKSANEMPNNAELKKKRRNLLKIGKPWKDDEKNEKKCKSRDIEEDEESISMGSIEKSRKSTPSLGGIINSGFLLDDDKIVSSHPNDITSNKENRSALLENSIIKPNVFTDDKPKNVTVNASSASSKKKVADEKNEMKKKEKLKKVDQKFKSLPVNKPNMEKMTDVSAQRSAAQQYDKIERINYITSTRDTSFCKTMETPVKEYLKESADGINERDRLAGISSFLHKETNGSTIAINN